MVFLTIALNALFQRCQHEEGQAMVEYVLLTTLMTMLTVTAFTYYTSSLTEIYSVVQDLFLDLSFSR